MLLGPLFWALLALAPEQEADPKVEGTEPAEEHRVEPLEERREVRPPDVALDKDYGWFAGTIKAQLDRDPTLIPFAKGAIFVPAMTNPLDEPPVSVWSGDRKVAEGTTGTRIILSPGTYEVFLGSGSEDDRINVQATVREHHTTVVPAVWCGLQVHIVDEQYASVRGSYELIRVEDREYIGIGFGADEQAGEPLSTWIMRPGLYKIVRVGENYRARRDFSTVRLIPGQLTHFLLVVNPETDEFVGGGEVPEDEIFRPREGFFGSLIIGGDASLNARNNVLGLPDGLSFTLRAFADARLSVEVLKNPLVLQLQLEEGQTKSPDVDWQKSNDRLDLAALYIYRLERWVGPYARFAGETNLLPGFAFLDEGTRVSLGGVESTTGRVTLSPPFGLTLLKEGAGLNLRLLKTLGAELTVRTGLGARHRLTRDLYQLDDDLATVPIEYERIPTTHQVGIEGTLLGVARITRWVLINAEVDSLLPFDDIEKVVLEVKGSIALKLTSYLSLNYVIRYRRDRNLSDLDTLQQDVRLRLSVEVF